MGARAIISFLFALSFVCGQCRTLTSRSDKQSVWGPSDSAHALDAVITAVNQIVNNPHLSAKNLAEAKVVAEDIKHDVETVENGTLSKEQAQEKVGAAIKELTSFEADLVPSSFAVGSGDLASKRAELEKELATKKAELAKDENMIKLLNLKKKLAEKRLKLQNLMDKKAAAANAHNVDGAEAAKTSEMVQKLLAATKALPKKDEDMSAPLKAILATVQDRKKALSDELAKLDVVEKQSEAAMESTIEQQMPSQSKDKLDDKVKGMLKHLKAEEHRKFAKAEASKRVEFNELKDAEESIQKHDVAGLQRVFEKMEGQSKALQAKAGKFLY